MNGSQLSQRNEPVKIATIAEKRNRNVKWAERAVRESISSTETEALKDSVIDLIARDLKDLLDKIDGKIVKIDSRRPPGVSSSIIRHSAPSSAAFLIELEIYSAVAGFIVPSIFIT